MTKYNIILADPPWSYIDNNSNGSRGAVYKYKTMSIANIKALPIDKIAKDNCALFLWCTSPLLKEGYETINAWGFKYKTVAFVWIKHNKTNPDFFKGLGHYTRGNAEFVLLGIRGKPLERQYKNITQIIDHARSNHSAKPITVNHSIDALYDPEKYNRIELFARKNNWYTPNWVKTGLEYDGNYIEDVLNGLITLRENTIMLKQERA